MIRCILSTEWGTLRYKNFADEAFVTRWNAACAELQLEPWRITTTDIAKSADEGSKYVADIKRSLSYSEMMVVGKMGGVKVGFEPDESSMIVRLEERVHALGMRLGDIERTDALAKGAAAIVHVPDQALLYVDEVTWEEDCCTEKLQDKLDEGWRILAVCPPCSQRRPDYILGRRKSLRPLPLAYTHSDKPAPREELDDMIPF